MTKNIIHLLTLFVAFLLFLNLSFAQTITFEKSYSELGDHLIGQSVLQLTDSSYMVGAYLGQNFNLIKFENTGAVIWQKQFETDNKIFSPVRTFPLKITLDDNLIAVSTKITLGNENLYLLKLDSTGDTIWTKLFNSELREFGSDIFQLEDSSYIALSSVLDGFSFKKAKIRKISKVGDLIWEKVFPLVGFNNQTFQLNKISNLEYIISGKRDILKINENGDSVWTKNFDFDISNTSSDSETNFIVGGLNNLIKIDSDGNIIWNNTIEGSLKVVNCLEDNSIISVWRVSTGSFPQTSSETKLTKFNSEGNLDWENSFRGEGLGIFQTHDNGFILTGNFGNYLWLLKTDPLGINKALELLYPLGGAPIVIGGVTQINWYYNDIESVNIDFSSDNGNTWNTIVQNYETTNKYYFWKVPDIVSDECKIRIYNSEDVNLIDVSEPFSIVFNPIEGYNFISANNVRMWISNNGEGSHNPIVDGSGFYWDTDNGSVSSIFEDGLVYGGTINGVVNVNGSTYRHGWQPGIILEDRNAADPNDASFKLWKIKKNWEILPSGAIRDEYEYNYNNWPMMYGAPFEDIDGNSEYTEGVDKPKFIGDEVLYFTANDLDPALTNFTYGSTPIGLEFHVTVWAYDTNDFLQDVVFKKYVMINKGNNTVEDMYFTYWTDDDLGFAGDEYVGCDTLSNLGYSYNADNYDEDYFGENPPAVGHLMVQGPISPTQSGDSAKFNNKWILDHENMPLSSFLLYVCGGTTFCDPELGTYNGAIEFYNNMKGLQPDGNPIINPISNDITKFTLAGDPVNGIGWYEGEGWLDGPTAGDRKYVMTSGPFTFAPGDTQEVVYAIFMAQGSDNIQSVAELKNTARAIQDYWDNIIYTDVDDENNSALPNKFELSQNYPNPFNPTTTIKYTIPSSSVMLNSFQHLRNETPVNPSADGRNDKSSVTLSGVEESHIQLKIYDILGREVKTLVNQKQKPGNYTIEFNASTLSSGVYFYKLSAGGFIETKKMILLR